MADPAVASIPKSTTGRPALDVATELVKRAGAIALEHFHREKTVSSKGWANLVTNVDMQVEQETKASLLKEFPGFGILSEESAEIKTTSAYQWVLDPIDGTRNYAYGLPHFAVNLALVERGEVLIGLTYDAYRNELFSAVKGGGTYLNGQPRQCSTRKTVEESLLGTDMGYKNLLAKHLWELVLSLWPRAQGVRVMGSAALGLAYAAVGRTDLYIHHDLAPWDLASGLLLVREAGGVITDKNGGPVTIFNRGVIATNQAILADFLARTKGQPWRNET